MLLSEGFSLLLGEGCDALFGGTMISDLERMIVGRLGNDNLLSEDEVEDPVVTLVTLLIL